jgi:hypothetical protein
VRWLFAYRELAGVVRWCSGVAIATMYYTVAAGVLFKKFPHFMTSITGWSYRHKSNYYIWIDWPL